MGIVQVPEEAQTMGLLMADSRASRTKGVGSARRVLQILLQFGEDSLEVRIDEIARQHEISIPSAYRYISLLRELRLIEERARGTYVLAPRVARLGEAAEASADLAREAEPVMARLVAEVGETVLVLRREGNSAVCVASIQPDQTLSLSFKPGQGMALHRGAGPKVLLAAMSAKRQKAYIDSLDLAADDLEKLQAELTSIRRLGSATSEAEVDDGIWATASPIVVQDVVLGALSLAGPSFRIPRERQLMLQQLAAEAAAQLGALVDSHNQ